MSKKNIGHNFDNLSSDLKKEILQSLVASLLDGLNEEEQKDILHAALTTQKKSRELIDMVGHWIKECADSGVSPVEMSKEVLSTISHSYELATYSTTELSGLFNDWLSEIEKEALVFLKGRSTAEPEMVAQHLRLERESAKFILDKLDREGRIDQDNKWDENHGI
jgi:hypothetical protein